MPRTGIADLPLHTGRAPRWLFALNMVAAEAEDARQAVAALAREKSSDACRPATRS
ncbi:hypothetical protein [Thermoflexus sp.]|uniref:hypothetical protein n=1 Tax=Thermoflexus sp. TaxID=1969742 RepID=UPI0033283A1E